MNNRNMMGLAGMAQLDARSRARADLQVENWWHFEAFRPNEEGLLVPLWEEHLPNLITNEGLNSLLDVYLSAGTQITAWYIGLIDAAGFTALAAGDTAAQINGTNGWAELSEYDEATREVWTDGGVSAQSVDNSLSVAQFTINATKTVKGAFMASASAKDAITGVLYGEVAFAADRSLVDNDVLNVTVTCTAASA